MSQKPLPQRPQVIKNMTLVSGVIATLCVLAALFLLYTVLSAGDRPVSASVPLLATVLLAIGIAYAFLTIEFYRLRPWAYQVMRAMVRGTLSPIFAMWGWYDAIDSEPVQRAFGLKPKKRR